MSNTKSYDLGNGWGIECRTQLNTYLGVKTYIIEVIMNCVVFEDVVERYIMDDPKEANAKFKELVTKYKALPKGTFI